MAESPPARPFWSGVLTFGLVSVPVELFAAVRPSGVALRTLGPDGRPLRRRYVSESGTPLTPDDIVRGVQMADQRFVTVTRSELEELDPTATREIDLRRFVPHAAIDPLYCDRPYFLLPDGEITKPYRLLARTMEETGQAGIASLVMRDHEYLVAIFAENGILRAETLRHADEVRTAEEVGLPAPANVDPKKVAAMRRAIEAAAAEELATDALVDQRADNLREIGARKAKQGLVLQVGADGDEEDEEAVDIMAVLRARLGASLQDLSTKELREQAQERQIPGRSKMSREELISALS